MHLTIYFRCKCHGTVISHMWRRRSKSTEILANIASMCVNYTMVRLRDRCGWWWWNNRWTWLGRESKLIYMTIIVVMISVWWRIRRHKTKLRNRARVCKMRRDVVRYLLQRMTILCPVRIILRSCRIWRRMCLFACIMTFYSILLLFCERLPFRRRITPILGRILLVIRSTFMSTIFLISSIFLF